MFSTAIKVEAFYYQGTVLHNNLDINIWMWTPGILQRKHTRLKHGLSFSSTARAQKEMEIAPEASFLLLQSEQKLTRESKFYSLSRKMLLPCFQLVGYLKILASM